MTTQLTITMDFYTEAEVAVLCGLSLAYVKANRGRKDWSPVTQMGGIYFYQKSLADIYIYTHDAYFFDPALEKSDCATPFNNAPKDISTQSELHISRGMKILHAIIGTATSTNKS